MDNYPRLVFHGHDKPMKNGVRQWRFRPKDVMILSVIAFSMSGLLGLGSIKIIDIIESFL